MPKKEDIRSAMDEALEERALETTYTLKINGLDRAIIQSVLKTGCDLNMFKDERKGLVEDLIEKLDQVDSDEDIESMIRDFGNAYSDKQKVPIS